MSTLGHPLADLGFCVIPWHSGPDEYRGPQGHRLARGRIPDRDTFVAGNTNANARPTGPLLPFHIASRFFRFAVIFVGIADRAGARDRPQANDGAAPGAIG